MRGDTSGAVEQLEETLRQAPEFARAHFALGMILALNGRHQQASERFAAAVTYQPDYVEARLGLADALRVTGRAEDSLPHYQRIVTADPRFAEAWLGFALALSDLGRHQEARRRLTEARTILPERPECNVRGWIWHCATVSRGTSFTISRFTTLVWSADGSAKR